MSDMASTTRAKSSKYKKYSNDGNRFVFDMIFECSRDGRSLRVLDVGCGSGDSARILQGEEHVVDGITISPEEAEHASRFSKRVFVHDLEYGLPIEVKDGCYDLVVCSHVLEHICFPERMLEDIKSALKPEGRLLVVLPNLMHYRSRISLMMGRFSYEEYGLMDYTHFRWYTYQSAKLLLENHGYSVLERHASIPLPFGRLMNRLPDKVQAFFKKALFSVSPGLFGGELVYKAVPWTNDR